MYLKYSMFALLLYFTTFGSHKIVCQHSGLKKWDLFFKIFNHCVCKLKSLYLLSLFDIFSFQSLDFVLLDLHRFTPSYRSTDQGGWVRPNWRTRVLHETIERRCQGKGSGGSLDHFSRRFSQFQILHFPRNWTFLVSFSQHCLYIELSWTPCMYYLFCSSTRSLR